MAISLLPEWSKIKCPVIGMLHLLPLTGSPGYGGNRETVRRALLADAAALVGGGVHGLMMENFGDAPFYPGRSPAHTVADVAALAMDVRAAHPKIPLGINILRNDGESALAVAAAVGAKFIRVNVLCGARVTDQGVLQGIAHDLLRLRKTLDAGKVKILADVDVKHSAPLAKLPIDQEVEDVVERGMADGLILSGSGTGKVVDVEKVRTVRKAAPRTPVFIGSGAGIDNVASFLPHVDGLIVGTSLKRNSEPHGPVEERRVKALLKAMR